MRQEFLRTNSMKFLRVPIGENSKICKNYSSDSKSNRQSAGRKKETQIDRHLKTTTTIPLTEKKKSETFIYHMHACRCLQTLKQPIYVLQ